MRLGACQYAAWSGGLGAVAVRCGDDERDRAPSLGGKASDLAFRVNRGEIVLNDGTSGSVWDVDDLEPQKIDNWNAFTASKKVEDEDKENQEQSNGDRRPPKAKPDRYGARAGRTTVLHPLDNDSAPEGRLLSIVEVDAAHRRRRGPRSAPTARPSCCPLPERARGTSFEYYIDDGRDTSAHATVTRGRPRRRRQPSARSRATGYKPRTWRVPAAGSLSVPVLADWRDDSDGDTVVLDSATAVGGEQTGRRRPHHVRRPGPLHRARATAASRSRWPTPSPTAAPRRSGAR